MDGGFENGNERRATGDLPPEPNRRGVRRLIGLEPLLGPTGVRVRVSPHSELEELSTDDDDTPPSSSSSFSSFEDVTTSPPHGRLPSHKSPFEPKLSPVMVDDEPPILALGRY